MKLILSFCFFPVLPILYFFQRNEAKPKNNIILSTTLPKEAWEDERVKKIVAQFKKQNDLTFLLLLLAYIPCYLLQSASFFMLYILIWLDLLIAVPSLPYYSNVKKMRALKKENWYHPELQKRQVVDVTAVSSAIRTTPSFYFVLPFIVSLLPMLLPLFQQTSKLSLTTFYIICITNTAVIALCYIVYRFMYRKRPDMINDNTNVTAALTRIRRYHWGKLWLYFAWLTAIFSFAAFFVTNTAIGFLVAMLGYSALTLIIFLRAEFEVRKMQQKINQTNDSVIMADEDDYWLLGSFYYNPNDSSTMVNSRIGMGTTMNLASPFGKGLTIFSLAILLLLPLITVPMFRDEFTEVRITATDTSVQAIHTKLQYEIPFADIREVSLLNELPTHSKTFGSGMDNVYKGTFSIKGVSNKAKVCLHPNAPLFLVIKTASETYVFGMGDKETGATAERAELLAIYDTISARLSSSK